MEGGYEQVLVSFRVTAPREVEKIGALNRKYTTAAERAEARRAAQRRAAAKRRLNPEAIAKRRAWREEYRRRPDVLEKIRKAARERMRALRQCDKARLASRSEKADL